MNLPLLTAAQIPLVVSLSLMVTVVVQYLKNMYLALPFVPSDGQGRDNAVRLFALLIAEALVLGGAASQGMLTAQSAFGFAGAAFVVAGTSLGIYHSVGASSSPSSSSSSALAAPDPNALIQAAINTFVPLGGVIPPSAPAPAPAPAPSAPVPALASLPSMASLASLPSLPNAVSFALPLEASLVPTAPVEPAAPAEGAPSA